MSLFKMIIYSFCSSLDVDCGSPEETAHGTVTLPNNATNLASYAQYSCEVNYKLEGYERRMCLENGSWSGSPPLCKGAIFFFKCCGSVLNPELNFLFTEITCTTPGAADDSGVVVSVQSATVGGQAAYSCQEGRRLVGPSSRKCLSTGLWEGVQPTCECRATEMN